MTVRDDPLGAQEYDKLRLVEFLEYIGRCAHAKYEGTEPLSEKVEKILDLILPIYGLKRNPVENEVIEADSSDESVIIEEANLLPSLLFEERILCHKDEGNLNIS